MLCSDRIGYPPKIVLDGVKVLGLYWKQRPTFSGYLRWNVVFGILIVAGCSSSQPVVMDMSRAEYVGSQSCRECHPLQAEQFRGSDHDMAMQLATEESVLADFDDVSLEHYGITSRMFKQNGSFLVRTEGPDGQLHDYPVKYVFGIKPLQQYMVEFPGEVSDSNRQAGLPRIQVLPLCWDTQSKEWFYLDPPDVHSRLSPRDDLHWTGIAQRWNTMCAECHTTNYRKNFEPAKMNSIAHHSPETVNQVGNAMGHYHSEFSEINVACETCHGPASLHVELAKKGTKQWNRATGYGLADLKQSAEHQIHSCAPCHSRRGILHGGFHAGDDYYDHHQLSLLTWPTYYPDGQILDENYELGSFAQSKMYHKGIRCTDCHDPHSAKLKHQGNQVCTSCHQHPAAKYDSPAHHFHLADSVGAQCVNCHMPSTNYMEVDARRDHSIRIPRPDMSLQMNTPNACTGCHLKAENIAEEKRSQLLLYQDWMRVAREGDTQVAAEIRRADEWCNEACDRWYGQGRRKEPHWGLALAAGQALLSDPKAKEDRNSNAEATRQLISVLQARGESAPFIARATALHLLLERNAEEAGNQAVECVVDEHPMVRAAAAFALRGQANSGKAVELLETLLRDTSRAVRFEAARSLLELPSRYRSPAGAVVLEEVLRELKEGLQYNNDRSGAHMSLGTIAEQQGLPQQAMGHYETALVVEPATVGPRTNLSAMLSRQIEENATLPPAVRQAFEEKVLLMRSQELELLARDVSLLPNPPAMLVFRYGLALYLNGRIEESAEQIVRAAELDTEDVTYAESAAEIYEKLNRYDESLRWASEAVRRSGGSQQSKSILQRIESQR